VNDGGNEQRVVTKCCFKAGLSATETLVLVQKSYGNEAVNRSNVFRWYSRFRDGRELVENDERGDRPKSIRTDVKIAAVADLVKNGRRIESRMIAESLNIPKTVVLRILKEDLGKRKLCAHFVPHSLTLEQREIESHLAKSLSRQPMQKKVLLTKLLREMRPGLFACDQETKRQKSEWVGETSIRPKKLKFQRFRIKNIFIFSTKNS